MPITKATASSVAPAAKGDLVVGSATNDAAILGVGTNNQVLTADSSTATGLKWATAASSNIDVDTITTGNLNTLNAIDLTGLTQNYFQLRISGAITAGSGTANFTVTVNNDTSGIYVINAWENYTYTIDINQSTTANNWKLNTSAIYTNATNNNYIITIFNGGASGYHNVLINGTHRQSDNANLVFFMAQGYVKTTAAISSIQFATSGANFTGGTYELIGG